MSQEQNLNELEQNENAELNEEKIEEQTAEEDSENNNEIEELNKKLMEKETQYQETLDLLKRTMADFDNFRKRTQREKETIYDDGFADAVKELLPVLDNLERATQYSDSEDKNALLEGVQMILKIFKDTLQKLGVEEIKADGEKFNPDFHNAIMHIEDENFEENTIVEVFQKGYKYKDKIIRYSLVKVAN
ncbi:Protein GrpE [Caloramator mitchellensis]|uniref:Protein GrpE n=1 Tax=Caloramator mitchellensis TaxID=908809 RepID=A0A0R3K388_CALMK|nr:nucleotide exchange factor GrpE [Caloramator mitchellensis]KRQ86783.1 Protein GrpE [Caloramator mitchellensis]